MIKRMRFKLMATESEDDASVIRTDNAISDCHLMSPWLAAERKPLSIELAD
jgi:hypothetical protein